MAPPPETNYDDEINGVDGDATSSGMEDVEDVKPHPVRSCFLSICPAVHSSSVALI
jgi:hypothetical protein